MISAKNLKLTFPGLDSSQDLAVLSQVSFHIAEGSRLAIMGPSGCGKTSLLRILSGVLTPSDGVVEITGQSVEAARSAGFIGFVPQTPALLPWRTVARNISWPLERSVLTKHEIDARVEVLLQLIGLTKFRSFHPRNLSGGMQSRVAIARALAGNPKVLLLDECFGSLDELTRQGLYGELSCIWEELNSTIAFVTHSVAEAVFLADQILILSSGPAKVREVLEITQIRPRSERWMETSDFAEKEAHVRRALRQASVASGEFDPEQQQL